MIVLIDAEEGSVTVCDKSVTKYQMLDINGIAAAIGGREVYYVTSAESVLGNDVVALVSQSTGVFPTEMASKPVSIASTAKYVHATKMSDIIIHGDDSKPLTLKGADDFRPLGSIPVDIMEGEQMRQYMKAGFVEIIDDAKRLIVIAEVKNRRKTIDKLKAQSGILVNDSKPGAAEKIAEGSTDGDNDFAPEIAISSTDQIKSSEQEVFRNIEDLGIELD